jgi:hypothetical protein
MLKVRGLRFIDGHSARLAVRGRTSAEVRWESNDVIRVTLPVGPPANVPLALQVTGKLPGNLRFARGGTGDGLLADMCLDGESCPAVTLQAIRRGMQLASEGRSRGAAGANPKCLAPDDVQAALDELDWDGESLVRHAGAWELRPRLAGESIPIQARLSADRTELVMRRTVLTAWPAPGSVHEAACADQALRFNSQLRLTRLAGVDGALSCEARLHAGQVRPVLLTRTAQAMAVASRHVGLPLRILAEAESVAQVYVRLLSGSCNPSAAGGRTV